MSTIQRDRLKIARQAVIGSGGRIVKELILENGTVRLVFDGCDSEKLRNALTVMVPDSTFEKISQDDHDLRANQS